MDLPDAVGEFADELSDALVHTVEGGVRGVYIHGSAVLGDWDERRSDVDVLVLANDESASAARAYAAVLESVACPGKGLEASVVLERAASAPVAPWPFVVHVNTVERRTGWGSRVDGDPDLALHYVVTRDEGWTAYGPPASQAIGRLPAAVVLRHMCAELRWAVDHATGSYAVLNACRALRFADDTTVCSKTEAGLWALERDVEIEVVRTALDDRGRAAAAPIDARATGFVLAVADRLEPPPPDE